MVILILMISVYLFARQLFSIFSLLRVDESGLQLRTKQRLSRKPKCYNEGGNFQSVRIYDCHSVFILYLVGILLSVAILFLEKLAFKYYKDKKVVPIQKIFINELEEKSNIDNVRSYGTKTYLPWLLPRNYLKSN